MWGTRKREEPGCLRVNLAAVDGAPLYLVGGVCGVDNDVRPQRVSHQADQMSKVQYIVNLAEAVLILHLSIVTNVIFGRTTNDNSLVHRHVY